MHNNGGKLHKNMRKMEKDERYSNYYSINSMIFKFYFPEINMERTRFYFHDLQVEDVNDDTLISLFDTIKTETESDDSPFYIEKTFSKHHLQILKKDIDGNEIFFFGKLIQSQKAADFREERFGELIEIDLDEDSGICKLEKGIIYFILYINKENNEKLLMVEDVPFALNIGGIVDYLKVRLNKNNIRTKQKLGRDLIPVLNAIGNNTITLAKLRLKKNISTDELAKLGVVEKAFKELKQEELDCEILIKWSKGKGEQFKDFLQRLFKIQNLSEISSVDFGSILRTLYFEIDSAIQPTINMRDQIIKFFPTDNKDYYLEHEEELYTLMKVDFKDKKQTNKLNG